MERGHVTLQNANAIITVTKNSLPVASCKRPQLVVRFIFDHWVRISIVY